jgi:hypothetical protein
MELVLVAQLRFTLLAKLRYVIAPMPIPGPPTGEWAAPATGADRVAELPEHVSLDRMPCREVHEVVSCGSQSLCSRVDTRDAGYSCGRLERLAGRKLILVGQEVVAYYMA